MKPIISPLFYYSLLGLFLLLSGTSKAQNFDKEKLNRYFDTLEVHNRFNGSVAVSKEGKILYTHSVGYADVEKKVKANVNTKYRIGSISKTFTATLVFMGVEEGKIDLSQNIYKFFPDVQNAKKITVQHLLNHHSGIHNFTDDNLYLNYNTQPKTEAEMIDIIVKGGSDFEPGSMAAYSNSNYVLLSYILERVFKKSYAELLQDRIVKPLGLKNTYFGSKGKTDKNESISYSWKGKWVAEGSTDMTISMGAGGIISTPTDMVKFSDGLFHGKLIKDQSLKTMTTLEDNFGMGLFQIPFYDLKGFGHTGAIDGFTSVFMHFSDGEISFALTSNGANMNTNDISIAVLSAVYGKPYDIPHFVDLQLTAQDLEKYVGVYASAAIPLKITISVENTTLMAQATGQPAFPLEATGNDAFKFDTAGVVMEFDPSNHSFVLKQGGGKFTFVKE